MIFRYCCGFGGQEKGMQKLENFPTLLTVRRFTKQRIAPVHGETNHFAHTVKLANGGKGNGNGEVVKVMCLRQATYRSKPCSV